MYEMFMEFGHIFRLIFMSFIVISIFCLLKRTLLHMFGTPSSSSHSLNINTPFEELAGIMIKQGIITRENQLLSMREVENDMYIAHFISERTSTTSVNGIVSNSINEVECVEVYEVKDNDLIFIKSLNVKNWEKEVDMFGIEHLIE